MMPRRPRSVAPLAAALVAGCILVSPLAAQDVISAGETRTGTLSSSDATLGDRSYYDNWIYNGRAGERIRIVLRSDDFDAYLALRLDANGGETLTTDDDGADGTNSAIEFTLPQNGRYIIRANSLSARETGSYTLSVSRQQLAGSSSSSTAGRAINPGEVRVGRLSSSDQRLGDNTYFQAWTFEGHRGENIRIELRSSDFDAYLSFGTERNGSFVSLASDDDGAGGTDSRIDITLPHSGRYVIRANTLFEGETGEYRLLVSQR